MSILLAPLKQLCNFKNMSLIQTQQTGHVFKINLNAPDTFNAMTEAMGIEFRKTINTIKSDNSVRVVILTGSGKAFSSGGHIDMLKAIGAKSQTEAEDALKSFYNHYLSLRELPQPVIAAINGAAVGAGFCLALACDLRLVSASAKMGANFAKIGIAPGMAATYLLQHSVGKLKASELLFTGKLVTATEALQMGLVNAVHPNDQLVAAAQKLAEEIANNAPLALRFIKESLQLAETGTLADIFAFDSVSQAQTLRTQDFAEGIDAAISKRQPKFMGN